eukprot:m.735543 g.735543  ORF g.735543 m.735543 type:complete len:122 (-) comp58893_c0_seq3:313-678(-)
MAGFGQETRQHQAEPEAEERLGVPPQYYMERREHDHSLQFHASNISSMMKRVLENTCRMFCFHEATVQIFERLSCCRCSRCGRYHSRRFCRTFLARPAPIFSPFARESASFCSVSAAKGHS